MWNPPADSNGKSLKKTYILSLNRYRTRSNDVSLKMRKKKKYLGKNIIVGWTWLGGWNGKGILSHCGIRGRTINSSMYRARVLASTNTRWATTDVVKHVHEKEERGGGRGVDAERRDFPSSLRPSGYNIKKSSLLCYSSCLHAFATILLLLLLPPSVVVVVYLDRQISSVVYSAFPLLRIIHMPQRRRRRRRRRRRVTACFERWSHLYRDWQSGRVQRRQMGKTLCLVVVIPPPLLCGKKEVEEWSRECDGTHFRRSSAAMRPPRRSIPATVHAWTTSLLFS